MREKCKVFDTLPCTVVITQLKIAINVISNDSLEN